MAGTFVGVCGVQQFQLSGSAPPYGSVPMSGGLLFVYNNQTTTLASVYQDIGLTVAQRNPILLDATGRIPICYVADGYYRLRLQDATGVITNGGFDIQGVPSIGASSSGGGGGGSVDPTTILATGDVKWRPVQGTLSGFVRCNGRTIGSTTSGATELADPSAQALFQWLWNNLAQPQAQVVGGRGASAAADWSSNKQITLPDLRGCAPFGLDDMGNVAAGRLTTVSTNTPTTPGSGGGGDSVILTEAQLAAHNHGGTTGTDSPDHSHTPLHNAQSVTFGPSSDPALFQSGAASPTGGTTGANVRHAHSIAMDGSNAAHLNMPPFLLGTWFIKL